MPRGQSYTDRLVQLFESRPGERFDGLALANIAGAYAWRTRVSEARDRLETSGLVRNEQRRRADGTVESAYYFQPYRASGQLEMFT